jgi:ABC-type phosphate/phosphonate transport system substrate-binding protein
MQKSGKTGIKEKFFHINLLVCLIHTLAFSQMQNGKFVFQNEVVILGFSANVFKHSNLADAKAVSSILLQQVLDSWSINLGNSVFIYENPDFLRIDIQKGAIDIIALTTPEYFMLMKQVKISPFLTYKLSDRILDRMLLIVRKDSGIRSLKGLKGRKIAMVSNPDDDSNLPDMWFTTVVLKNGDNYRKDFASSIYKVRKGTNAISDVFFKNADAAVVPEMELSVSRELNPQIGRELSVIDSSKQMLFSVLCYTGRLTSTLARYKDRDLQSISDLLCNTNNTEAGRHFLSIFRITSFVPFEGDYLNDTEMLFNDFTILWANRNRRLK